MKERSQQVILFDGVCNFCNGVVNFIITHDSSGKFRFASLQSKAGQQYLAKFSIPLNADSVVLIQEGQYYLESDAAIRISQQLDGMVKLLSVFAILPRGLRDRYYRWIAKRRYQLFGKQNSCMIPTESVRERFILDD